MKESSVFIDEAKLEARAGDGGDGRVSFRREKFAPLGGPDGGDGGRGGSVILVADRNLATLREQRFRSEVHAENGVPGAGNNRAGANGEDLRIRVPVGTEVFDAAEGNLLADLSDDGAEAIVARGGRGGRGNARFATATRQTPEFATPGRPGQHASLRLSLKLLADVGLVGLPNAGKSTLLSVVSAARPRIADYPFTTLTPSLGVVEVGYSRFVVADIPGLIEGASEGAGLGDRFLRHIERTRLLVHVIDVGSALLEERNVLAEFEVIRQELASYDQSLLERVSWVLFNKVDLLADRGDLEALQATLESRGHRVTRVSGATREGIDSLVRALAQALEALPKDTEARS